MTALARSLIDTAPTTPGPSTEYVLRFLFACGARLIWLQMPEETVGKGFEDARICYLLEKREGDHGLRLMRESSLH
jgi:hypothetical protein